MTPRSLLLGLALCGSVALTACERSEVNGISSQTADEANPPQLDLIGFDGCTTGRLGWVSGTGTIENHSPQTATFEVVVGYLDDGVRLDQASTWIRDLKPGETASFEAVKHLGDRAPNVDDCQVITINRV